LRCDLEIVQGAPLLGSGLNYFFDALHWQLDEAAPLLTPQGRHIDGLTGLLGLTAYRVELSLLFIGQRLVKSHKRRTEDLYCFNGRIHSLLNGIFLPWQWLPQIAAEMRGEHCQDKVTNLRRPNQCPLSTKSALPHGDQLE